MTDSNQDDWLNAITKHIESSRKIKSILEKFDKEKPKEERESLSREWYEQYAILVQSYADIRSNMRPATIIPGIENEDDIDWWRELGNKDKYTIMENLEFAWNHYVEFSEMEDPLNDSDGSHATVCAEMLKILIDFPFFKPDTWCKKEDELKPLYIKGAGIPNWLSARYREAVYSYIYGFNNAAIAICRSIVEGVLTNKYNIKSDLNNMIEFHVKTVKDKKHAQVSWNTKKIRMLANHILHDICKTATDNEVKESLLYPGFDSDGHIQLRKSP